MEKRGYSRRKHTSLASVLGFLFTSNRQIVDDGFKHALIVYEDHQTKGIRLQASVWEGELRGTPVWTAIGSYIPSNPFFRLFDALLGAFDTNSTLSHPPVCI